jgi:(2Fe-2S) ferredoxin
VLKSAVKQAGMKGAVRINQSGCLGQCGHGPMAVVYPEGVWYSHLDEASAKRIFVEHLQASRPVEELRYQTPHGGSCELPRRPDGSVDSEAHGYQACNRCPSGPATSS